MTDSRDIIELPAFTQFTPPPIPSAPPVGTLVRLGVAIAAVFIGGGLAWASLAPLSSAAIAPGVVNVETRRQTVQHLEGGIIREILVREGDLVSKDQVLMRLDDRETEADRSALSGQINAFLAREARLVAQRDGASEIAFPHDLLVRRDDQEVRDILAGQRRIFADQTRVLEGEIDIFARRILQHRAQIGGIRAQIEVTQQQMPKLEEELRDVRTLFSKGLGLKPRVLDLERRVLAAKGEERANESRIGSLDEQVKEAEAQIESLRRKRAREVSEELREVQTKLAEMNEALNKAQARTGRREVKSPHEGVIMNLKYTTPGGVIPPGGAILDLVPREEKLIVEVRVSPLDIDVVRPDLPVSVRLVAYKRRTTPVLNGRVVRVAPDAVVDEKSGSSHFMAIAEVPAAELARAPNLQLYPGMPVEAAILTGERRMIDYITQPFTDSLSRAFRED